MEAVTQACPICGTDVPGELVGIHAYTHESAGDKAIQQWRPSKGHAVIWFLLCIDVVIWAAVLVRSVH